MNLFIRLVFFLEGRGYFSSMEEEWRSLKSARNSLKRGLTLRFNTASEVLKTEGSADDVKGISRFVRSFRCFRSPEFRCFRCHCENFKTNLKDEDDLEEGLLSLSRNTISKRGFPIPVSDHAGAQQVFSFSC